jgi:hypothetical protein
MPGLYANTQTDRWHPRNVHRHPIERESMWRRHRLKLRAQQQAAPCFIEPHAIFQIFATSNTTPDASLRSQQSP